MEITDIRVRRVGGDGKLRAYVTVTFDAAFVVHNIKVIHGRNGVFIAMPSRRTKTGEYKDVAHPIHSDFRTSLQDQVLAAYQASLDDPNAPLHEDDEDGVVHNAREAT
jgi:stage V sporulation protein G